MYSRAQSLRQMDLREFESKTTLDYIAKTCLKQTQNKTRESCKHKQPRKGVCSSRLWEAGRGRRKPVYTQLCPAQECPRAGAPSCCNAVT